MRGIERREADGNVPMTPQETRREYRYSRSPSSSARTRHTLCVLLLLPICVLILLHVSSYYCMCAFTLVYMYPDTTVPGEGNMVTVDAGVMTAN
jgi:hypothetical protein